MKLKRSGILTKIILLAIIIYAVCAIASSRSRIEEAEENRDLLQAKVDAALQENAELSYDIEHADDPETMEEIARTKLGLVEPGEKIFYDVNN